MNYLNKAKDQYRKRAFKSAKRAIQLTKAEDAYDEAYLIKHGTDEVSRAKVIKKAKKTYYRAYLRAEKALVKKDSAREVLKKEIEIEKSIQAKRKLMREESAELIGKEMILHIVDDDGNEFKRNFII